jgi:hypothetical protein
MTVGRVIEPEIVARIAASSFVNWYEYLGGGEVF